MTDELRELLHYTILRQANAAGATGLTLDALHMGALARSLRVTKDETEVAVDFLCDGKLLAKVNQQFVVGAKRWRITPQGVVALEEAGLI